jgi:hypothetical protein
MKQLYKVFGHYGGVVYVYHMCNNEYMMYDRRFGETEEIIGITRDKDSIVELLKVYMPSVFWEVKLDDD